MSTGCADNVVLSFALGGWSSVALHGGLQNAVLFTVCPLIVHVSANSHLNADLDGLMRRTPRVHFNPMRLNVTKHNPSVLAAHLSNFEFCSRPHMPCDAAPTGRLVLMATNQ
jgi:hypothetical protein